MQYYSSYGVNVRKVMLEKGITLTSLSKEVGISISYLSEILKGKQSGKKQKVRINEILGIESY